MHSPLGGRGKATPLPHTYQIRNLHSALRNLLCHPLPFVRVPLPSHLTFALLHRPPADLHLCTVFANHRPPKSVIFSCHPLSPCPLANLSPRELRSRRPLRGRASIPVPGSPFQEILRSARALKPSNRSHRCRSRLASLAPPVLRSSSRPPTLRSSSNHPPSLRTNSSHLRIRRSHNRHRHSNRLLGADGHERVR